jgi:SAM-dependent methyltransferase
VPGGDEPEQQRPGGSSHRVSDGASLSDAWESHAQQWIVWARAPDHDGFWSGTWPELRAVLPPPDGLVLEVGCGEGRVGRELLALGHRVVGIERSASLVHAAGRGDPGLIVVRADAALLPVGDAVAAVVVACMSLHDVDDLPGTLAEAYRVLRPGGQLCFAMVHPFASAQDPSTMHTDHPTVTEPYLVERRVVDRIERDGLEMTFVSTHRPLSAYVFALAEAGFVLSALREFGARPIPWLLVGRADKSR